MIKISKKLPPSKEYYNREIEDWTVLSFTEYLKDKHREIFGIEYAPMRSWRMEQGQIGRLIGTARKEGSHSKAVVKRFIDEAFESYKPTPQYPGTNFGFIYAYRRNILQRLEAEEIAESRREKARAEAPSLSELEDWL